MLSPFLWQTLRKMVQLAMTFAAKAGFCLYIICNIFIYYSPSRLIWCYQRYRPGHTGINHCPIKYNDIHMGIVTEHTEGCFSGCGGGQSLGIQ